MATFKPAQSINGRKSLNTDPTRNFRFIVTFQPYDAVLQYLGKINFGFTSVAGLNMAVESIPYREGGMNTTLHQIPGQASFSPLTLTRGVHLGNSEGWRWIRQLFATTAGTATGPDVQFRSSVTVRVLQHPVQMGGTATPYPENSDTYASHGDPVAMSFRFYNAWIQALAWSDLNAGDNAIMVEQMTLVHEGFSTWFAGENQLGVGAAKEKIDYAQAFANPK